MSGQTTENDISIIVGTQQIAGWESAHVTQSAEMFPNSFALSMSQQFISMPNQPGAPCKVYVGKDLVITGYVDRLAASMRADRHDIELVGRGICEDLVDCSADLLSADSPVRGGSIAATSALDLAQKLCKVFKITARCAISDLGYPIPVFQVAMGETPYEVIEKVAHYAGYLVYEDSNGNLVLDRVGTKSMASGFVQGVNVEAATYTKSVDRRFTHLTTVYTTIDSVTEGSGVDPSIKKAEVTDDGLIKLGRYRPRLIVSNQTDGRPDFAMRMAKWDLARRIGRSQAVQLTCDSWRDSKGALWKPNYLAPVSLPDLPGPTDANWIIASVTFRKDLSGTHADLTLMPPDAFSIEPSVINIFDSEINAAVPTSQSPAPPSTSYAPRPAGGANS